MSFAPTIESLESRQLLAVTPVPDVKVMTQNVYYGGGSGIDIFASAFTDLWKNVEDSKIPERARAIAAQIKAQRPDFVALQEAVIWRHGTPFFPSSAKDVKYDFTAEILRHLTHRKWRYVVVSKVTNADWEIPGRVGSSIKDIRMTDQDVILARVARGARFRVSNPRHGNFRNNLSIDVPVIDDIDFNRGWASIDARYGKRGPTIRLINTHLEVLDSSIQQRQARELLSGPASNTRVRTILTGDFNSDATIRQPSYRILTDGGFRDAWSVARPGVFGPTASQDDDLRNDDSKLIGRIDLVLYRGPNLHATAADRVNEEQRDKTPSGLWPSDHAGVVATVRLAPPSPAARSAASADVAVGKASVPAGIFARRRDIASLLG